MSELKPCPFCGGYATILHPNNEDHFGYFHSVVCCVEEGCRGEQFDTWYVNDEEAIEAWNTRYEPTCQMQRVRRDKYVNEYKCQTCYGHIHAPVGTKLKYCCYCGSKVVIE